MGLGLGTVPTTGDAVCNLFSNLFGTTPAGTAAQISVGAPAGMYCVEVFDFGNALQPIAYTVERYLGHVSSRERVRQLLGPQMDTLLDELNERISRLEPSGAFIEQNLAYVVSARRSP